MWSWVTGGGASAPSEPEQAGAKLQSQPSVVPGLPSPTSDFEFAMVAGELLEEVRKYGEQDCTAALGWTPVAHSTPNVELFERKIPRLENTSLTFMKCIGVVEGATPEDILNFTLEADLKKRQEFDPDISLLDRVKEIKPGLEVTRTHFVAPFPVYPREFIDMRTWVEGGDKIIFGAQSINFPESPWSADHVRGVSWNGIIMELLPNKATRIVFMGYVDPMGWVPHAVIAVFRAKITERIEVLRKLVAKGKK